MLINRILKNMGFKVFNVLGRGAFSEVRLATSPKYPGKVAIKIMDRNKEPPGLINQELEILESVEHPHIIKVHDILERLDGKVFVVMEAAATDLHRKIWKLGRIPTNQANVWFSELVSAVDYLHNCDIVHRDLTCRNVLLTADGKIKLTDFGLAGHYDGLSKMYLCTHSYAAPEVLAKKPYNPKDSDVWSLGVIYYNMVTGVKPFNINDWNNFLNAQKQPLQFQPNVKLEEPCRTFIAQMMNYRPSCRLSIKEVAQHPWLQSRQEGSDTKITEQKNSGVVASLTTGLKKIYRNLFG